MPDRARWRWPIAAALAACVVTSVAAQQPHPLAAAPSPESASDGRRSDPGLAATVSVVDARRPSRTESVPAAPAKPVSLDDRKAFQRLFNPDWAGLQTAGIHAVKIPARLSRVIVERDPSRANGPDDRFDGPVARFARQTAQKPPEPRHTGVKALLFETVSDFQAFTRRRSTWVILAAGGGAAALAHPFDDEVNGRLGGSAAARNFFGPGKYLGAVYTQAGAAVGLYVIGRYVLGPGPDGSRTNNVSHIGFDMLRAVIVSQGLTQAIKVAVRRDRPDGQCCAFPSGHASATFATAAVLERHFGYRGSWPTFLIATYVATSRLHDNRHFLSDVVFGAALGISTGWTVVGRHGRSTFTLTPVPIHGGVMVALTRREGGRVEP